VPQLAAGAAFPFVVERAAPNRYGRSPAAWTFRVRLKYAVAFSRLFVRGSCLRVSRLLQARSDCSQCAGTQGGRLTHRVAALSASPCGTGECRVRDTRPQPAVALAGLGSGELLPCAAHHSTERLSRGVRERPARRATGAGRSLRAGKSRCARFPQIHLSEAYRFSGLRRRARHQL
jgi:hypothetical protein